MNTESTARIIREIPATINNNFTMLGSKNKVQRVCAYARVSTNTEEQLTSYETQCSYYNKVLKNKIGIDYVGLYTDEGISGKSIKARKGFQEMIQDCYAGKIDRIYTKSVSRFARNAMECQALARDLKNRGVTIFFESQGVDTKDESAFVVLSILASLAEEDIRTMSNNIKWGFRKRYADGNIALTQRMFGYDIKKGKFTIIQDEAIIVQNIFERFLQGNTLGDIVKYLNVNGIKSPGGKKKWSTLAVKNVLNNEKYKGDVILQKTFKNDVLDSKRQINNGQLNKYVIENNHLPIVQRKIYDAVQEEIKKRQLESITTGDIGSRYSSKYPFSGMIECGECGTKFRRFSQTHQSKSVIVWVCQQHQKDITKCKMKPIKEKLIEDAFIRSLNYIITNKDTLLNITGCNIESVLDNSTINDLNEMQKTVEIKQKRLLELTKLSYKKDAQLDKLSGETTDLIAEIKAMNNNITRLKNNKSKKSLQDIRLKDIKKYLDIALTEFNGTIFRQLIEKVIAISSTRVRFVFKVEEIQIEQDLI